MGLSSLLLLLPLIACGGDSGANKNPTKSAKAKAKAKVKAETEQPAGEEDVVDVEEGERDPTAGLSGFDRARSLTAARRHLEAVQELEALLATSAEDSRVWQLLRHSANSSGESGALLDRLDATTPLGGQAVQHQMLRANLALDADRADDAMDAAQRLAKSDVELGAVFMARALLAGAAFDTAALDKKDANDALVLAAVERKSAKAKGLLKSTAPATWQGLLLRAETYDRVGDSASALADLEAVLASEDSEAAVRAAPLASRLLDDRAQAANRLGEAATKAEALGFSERACALTGEAVDAWLAEGRTDEALSFATARYQARYDAVDDLGAAQAAIALAEAANAEGHALSALEHASAAQATLTENDDAWLASQAAWQAGLAAYTLGLDAELATAIEAAPANGKDALTGLRQILVGDADEAYVLLQNSEITGADGVRIQLAGARAALASGNDPGAFTSRAVELSESAAGAIRIEALLEQDRYARAFGSASDLSGLESIASDLGEAGGPLTAEVILRKAFNGSPPAPDDDGSLTLPADLDAWRTALDPSAPAAETAPDDLPGLHGHARALARAGAFEDALPAYKAAWAATPTHHRGPWYPLSIQTGTAGPDIWTDSALLRDQNAPAAIALLAAHDWWHSARQIDAAFAIGDDPSAGLDEEGRRAYNDAHAQLRGATLRWLAGLGPEPVEARASLAEKDAAALAVTAFARSLSEPPPDYLAIQGELKGMAILSYRIGPSQADGVVVTADGAAAKTIEDVAGITAAADALRQGYAEAAGASTEEALADHGNQLRVLLVEPFRDHLTGTGRYIVVPDGALWGVSFAVLPEQHASKRYLAEIRKIGYATTVGDAWRTERTQPTRYVPNYLGISRLSPDEAVAADGVRIPTEVENSGRHFDQELRVVATGEEATKETFTESAGNARFIHLADVSEGERGSIQLAGDSVDLATIRGMDLHARMVLITGDVSPEAQLRWAQAFQAAGCATVITPSWTSPLESRSKFVYTFYESLIQHGEPGRALLQARQALREQQNLKGLGNDPTWWGPFFLYGRP